MEQIENEIARLKEEHHAVILAHYYVPAEVQRIADYVGDSFYLSKKAKETDAQTIVFAGVRFMGESAKILNPKKRVLMPDDTADCPMAHMITAEAIAEMRRKYDDLAVVCYVNSTAEIKACSDVCVTSSNAVKIVRKLPQHHIFFIPDKNLAYYVGTQVPEKHIIYNDGYCPRHNGIQPDVVQACKHQHSNALFLAHPECPRSVLELADYIGSTSGIIEYAGRSDADEFIIGTEDGVMYELTTRYPGKVFYSVMEHQSCEDMKKVTLEKVLQCLKDGTGEITLADDVREKALRPLDYMLELAE